MTTEVRLSLDWELWVVEHLLFSGKRERLIDLMAEQGLPRDAIAAQVDAIESNPGFERLRARVAEGALAARLQRLHHELSPLDAVPVRPDIDRETLLREHWIPSVPVKLTEAAAGLRALDWTFRGLAERFGDAEIPVNVRRGEAATPRETERWLRSTPLAEFVDAALSDSGNEMYVVSRCGLLTVPELAPLWEDLTPLPQILEPLDDPPHGASMWIGPAGTRTPPHWDPHNVLLVQVEGSKRIRLAPRVRADQAHLLDGYYLSVPLEEASDRVFEVLLEPGESLFVPAAWFHEVIALEPSITLSLLSFPWPNHFHWLGPPGSGRPVVGWGSQGNPPPGASMIPALLGLALAAPAVDGKAISTLEKVVVGDVEGLDARNGKHLKASTRIPELEPIAYDSEDLLVLGLAIQVGDESGFGAIWIVDGSEEHLLGLMPGPPMGTTALPLPKKLAGLEKTADALWAAVNDGCTIEPMSAETVGTLNIPKAMADELRQALEREDPRETCGRLKDLKGEARVSGVMIATALRQGNELVGIEAYELGVDEGAWLLDLKGVRPPPTPRPPPPPQNQIEKREP